MNFHSDEYIMKGVAEHLDEAKEYFNPNRIVGIFYQGSGNYGLDYEGSDIDTKLIIVPTFEQIAFNKQPCSTTHIRNNDEHIDFKDIRLYMQTFRKQNLNFLEILFTDFKYVNEEYAPYWNVLVENREKIARYNLYQAVKSMKGIALEKYHAMEHPYPSKLAILEQYGYDPKQLHHLLRVEDYIRRYIDGEAYEDCLRPTNPEYLMEVKRGKYDLAAAREVGRNAITRVEFMADNFTEKVENKGDPVVDRLLDDVQYDIMKDAIRKEIVDND